MNELNTISDLLALYRSYEVKGPDRNDWDIFPDSKFIDYISGGLNRIDNGFVYIFDFINVNYKYVGENIEKILGVSNTDLIGQSVDAIAEKLHPEDIKNIISIDKCANDLFCKYGTEKGYKTKGSYDYRIKNEQNKYIRIMQENMILQYSPDGGILYSIGLVTDITHKKSSDKLVFCFECPEPDDRIVKIFAPGIINPEAKITAIEQKILCMFSKGYCTKEIAKMLNRSPYTIDTYRKKLQKKTNTANTTELVSFAICSRII